MPRVLVIGGFVIYIFPNDHEPMHVHVYEGSATGPVAIVNLLDLSLRFSRMKTASTRKALTAVSENRVFLISEWVRIDPKPERWGK